MRSRFIELITVTASSIIELSTTLLITKIVAVQLSKDGYGFYSLILSVVALFSLLPFSSLHVGIERYIIEYKNLIINLRCRLVMVSGHLVTLYPKEFAMLCLLANYPG